MNEKENSLLKKSYLSLDRAEILNYSLQLETFLNHILIKALSINEHSCIAFGNSSRALSFNSKIILLLDLDGISKVDQTLLTKFAEIRNKFAHVLDCHYAKDFFKMDTTGTLSYLEKRYQLGLDYSENSNCMALIEKLIEDIEDIIKKIIKTINKNEFDIGKLHISSKIVTRIIEVLNDDDYLSSIKGRGKKNIIKNFLRKIASEFEEIDDNEMAESVKRFKLI